MADTLLSFRIKKAGGTIDLAIETGENLLEALVDAGIFLRSDCGGRGVCGKCRIRIEPSDDYIETAPGEADANVLGEKDIKAGFRLACRVKISDNLVISIPEESGLIAEEVKKPPLPHKIKTAPLENTVNPKHDFGLALDLGTTTIAVYLCDLTEGHVISSLSVKNPQALYGEDVISRISAASENSNARPKLQALSLRAVEWAAMNLLDSAGLGAHFLRLMTVVGNSTMIHLFLGENPESMGRYPFEPLFIHEKSITADRLGLKLNPDMVIRTLPLISGFLGSDIVAAGMAVDMEKVEVGTLLADVGTNGEILLKVKDGFLAASCATGPAFEGAAIKFGMPAVSGAIDSVSIDDNGNVSCSLIQRDKNRPHPASGICGSGVVSAVSELLRLGGILPSGRYEPIPALSDHYQGRDNRGSFLLVPGKKTNTRRDIHLTQKDVRAVQLAKGALYTGIELLTKQAGMKKPKKILLAGGFGNYLNKSEAMSIGMFPEIPLEQIITTGNAAGAGAVMALLDPEEFIKAKDLVGKVTVKDLSQDKDFQDSFLASLEFPSWQ